MDGQGAKGWVELGACGREATHGCCMALTGGLSSLPPCGMACRDWRRRLGCPGTRGLPSLLVALLHQPHGQQAGRVHRRHRHLR